MDIELVSLSRTHTTIMDQSQNTTSLNIQMNSQPNFLQLIIVFAAKNPRSFVRGAPGRPPFTSSDPHPDLPELLSPSSRAGRFSARILRHEFIAESFC